MYRAQFVALLCLSFAAVAAQTQQVTYRFTCGKPEKGARPLTAHSLFREQDPEAYGFDLSTVPAAFTGGVCTSDKPFFFSVAVPEGSYNVTLSLGSPSVRTTTTVRGESRRLFIDQLSLSAGKQRQVTFNVHVRTPAIGQNDVSGSGSEPAQQVKLKPREIGALDWDKKLTLEFNGDHPSVRAITIAPATTVPTLYLAGDSTVVDQDKEPWAAWGQMLPVFFGEGLTISNQAESGETIRSFVSERRWGKILSTLKPGDFVMIQFAHNDQKPGAGYVPADTDYKDYLRRYIAESRAKGATPILVTSMHRRRFTPDGKIIATLGDYPQAMRDIAAEQQVPLVDLNKLSATLFEALGEQGTLHAFVHYPANTFPNQPEALADDTHFNGYGAYELARAIVQSIRDQHLPLDHFLRPGVPAYDPAHPTPYSTFTLPPSPLISTATPYGR